MSNSGYKDGFESGYKQATNGENKDVRPNLIKATLNEAYRREYASGIEDGYRKGMTEKQK